MRLLQSAPACLLLLAALLAPAVGAALQPAAPPPSAPPAVDAATGWRAPAPAADPVAALSLPGTPEPEPVARPIGDLARPHPVGPVGVPVGEDRDRPLHAPVSIVGDAAFRLPGSGVVRGSGTPEDPYVIEGWRFRAVDGRGPAILLAETTAHVVVRGNVVESASETTAGAESDLGRWHDVWPLRFAAPVDVAGYSIYVRDAENVRIEANRFTTLHLECERCAVEGNAFVHALAPRLVESTVSGNTLATLHVQAGAGNVVSENEVPAWVRWAYPFHFDGGSLARFEGNVVRGTWQQGVVVECEPGDEVALVGNDLRLENRITSWVVHATGCARVLAEDNRFSRGVFAVERSGHLEARDNRFDNNSVYLTDVDAVDWARNELHAGTLLVHGGGHVAFRDSAFRGFTEPGRVHRVDVKGAARVLTEGGTFEDVQHGLEDTVATVRDSTFHRGYVLVEGDSEARVEDSSFDGLLGIVARDSRDVVVSGVTIRNVELAVHLSRVREASVRGAHIEEVRAGLVAQRGHGLEADSVSVRNATEALVLSNVQAPRLRDVTLEGPSTRLATYAADATELPSLENVTVNGRPVVREDGCSSAEAAAAAARAAYLVLVDCEGLRLQGDRPHLLGVAAARTPVTLVNASLHPGALTVASVAEAAPLNVEGADLRASGWSLVGLWAEAVTVTGTRIRGPGVLAVGGASALQDSVIEGGFVLAADAESLEVTGSRLQGAGYGVVSLGGAGIRVEGNEIAECGTGVLLLHPTPTARVLRNVISGCESGIATNEGATIRGNLLAGATRSAGVGIGVFDAPERPATVEGNVLVGFRDGLLLHGTGAEGVRHLVRENRVGGAGESGLRLAGAIADVARNRFEANGWGVVATCPRVAPDRCPSLLLRNALHDNAAWGLDLHIASPALHHNSIQGNRDGLHAVHPMTRAPGFCRGTGNWWGHAEGPAAGDRIECRLDTPLGHVPATPPPRDWLNAPPADLLATDTNLRLEAPATVMAGDVVTFSTESARLVLPGDGPVLHVGDDGRTEHAYAAPGAYTAWALGWDADGQPTWDRVNVQVT